MSDDTVDISALRRSVTGAGLERSDLDGDPVTQFQAWFGEACEAIELDPNAMALSTVDADGRPACRTVLLKYFDHRGFVFFTNTSSSKAVHIEANPNVALLFFWSALGRQVGIRGKAERLTAKETMAYFATRPRGSQIGAWVSVQSSVISSRSLLEAKFEEMKRKFADGEVPLPSFWRGYRVVPEEFEFWQGQSNRLHDRFRYCPQQSGWFIERLSP